MGADDGCRISCVRPATRSVFVVAATYYEQLFAYRGEVAMKEDKSIVFTQVEKNFGQTNVIPPMDLMINSGERLVLLGPSGCGKSTLLRLIAGLEQPTSGTILMGGQAMAGIDVADRNVAMVFQNYALYPHMTVFDNIAFSLTIRKKKKQDIREAVEYAAGLVELKPYLERKPAELSGGQRQRVALARAVVKQAPFFLLDEPLSNLDALLRVSARNDLIELHNRLKQTMVYVTHDQLEAMTIGQRIAVMNGGVIEQIGTPEDIYEKPKTRFVATFIGTPPMNMLPADAFADRAMIPGVAEMGVRPEHIMFKKLPEACVLHGEYVRKEYIGSRYVHYLTINGVTIQVVAGTESYTTGQKVDLSIPPEHLHFFDEAGNRIEVSANERHERLAVHA
ncbi:glycerol-3-phosphate ABC transporter ATP-binding protein [Shouchella clausii]|nr:glycerol-3-phosphate ABC transporter ATP-binding protein [Shouchella clausii]